MSVSTSNSDVFGVGRAKHLYSLLRVFQHRNGSWGDFGRFLESIFTDPSQGGRGLSATQITCRHNSGGKHYGVLAAAAAQPENYPMFDHERYRRPCISTGAFEDGKNPGLVVADLCEKAGQFLSRIGKGDPEGYKGRDFDFEPSSSAPPSSVLGDDDLKESQTSGDLEVCEIPDSQESQRFRLRSRALGSDNGGDEEIRESDFMGVVEEEEAVEPSEHSGPSAMTGWRVQSSAISSGEMPSGDSPLQHDGRSSTKMRAATLGYLWGFARQPNRLREQFWLLVTRPDLHVLHLCGCGMSYTTGSGVRIPGCVEYSHLRLGSPRENGHHRNFHIVLSFTPVENYAVQCGLLHQSDSEYGAGIF